MMTASEMGKKAAEVNKAKGSKYFSELGKKSAEARKAKKDSTEPKISDTKTPPKSARICKHGINIDLGQCKFGCR